MRFDSVYTRTSRGPLHARINDRAAGEPVVLVHGIGASSRYLMPLARRLAAAHPVFVPDFPGFGRSAKPRRALTLRELADVLDEWMSLTGLERAAMIGNSFGCEIVVEAALVHPRRVGAAVFLGPTIDRRARTVRSQAARFIATALREPLGLTRPLLVDYLQAGIKRPLRTLRYALDDPVEDKLPKVEIPVLVLRGSKDAIVPQRWAEEVAERLPRGELQVLPGGAHALNYDSAAPVTAAVERFLDQPWNPPPSGG